MHQFSWVSSLTTENQQHLGEETQDCDKLLFPSPLWVSAGIFKDGPDVDAKLVKVEFQISNE